MSWERWRAATCLPIAVSCLPVPSCLKRIPPLRGWCRRSAAPFLSTHVRGLTPPPNFMPPRCGWFVRIFSARSILRNQGLLEFVPACSALPKTLQPRSGGMDFRRGRKPPLTL